MPVILTGDMNFRESSLGYRLLVEDRSGLRKLVDARYVSETPHKGPTASTSNWVKLRPPESRIDYILVNPELRVKSHRILDDQFDGRYPSDHLPVLAEVTLERTRTATRP
jgi:endonuclease/exonuclease/phosphatase family metal-dependent hydrolase